MPVVIFEISVKVVVFPIQTLVAVKFALGNGFTEAVAVTVPEQPVVMSVKVSEYVPAV